jgi:hypothetical protein
MREDLPEEPNDDRDSDEDEAEAEADADKKPRSAPTRAGSNVPNAGRDPDEGRNE